MPNWCSNYLTVTGSVDALTRFKEQARDKEENTDLSLQKLIPQPKELEGTISPPPKPGLPDWYTWRCNNWGCKWDVEAEAMFYNGEEGKALSYSFDSPWSPPCAGILTISKMFPTLTFMLEYEEGGMGFMGKYQCHDGEVEIDDSYDMEYGDCPHCKEYTYKNLAGDCSMCGETVDKLLPHKEKEGV